MSTWKGNSTHSFILSTLLQGEKKRNKLSIKVTNDKVIYRLKSQKGSYFTAVDLAEIGQELDRAEQQVGGSKRGGESQNYDDSGYFSIQVSLLLSLSSLSYSILNKRANSILGTTKSTGNLELGINSLEIKRNGWSKKRASVSCIIDKKGAVKYQDYLSLYLSSRNQQAYICNLRNHWFTLRKFSEPYRWYNLDSMQPSPTYLGENYLAMMLQQIENEGYSIFVVKGKLDDSTADRKARALLKPQVSLEGGKPGPIVVPFSGQGYSLSSSVKKEKEEDEDEMLAKAIQASMEEKKSSAPKDDMDEIRRKRLARFGG